MTIVRKDDGDAVVKLVECPFCGKSLKDRRPPDHLQQCEGFYHAFDMEVPGWLKMNHDLEAADG